MISLPKQAILSLQSVSVLLVSCIFFCLLLNCCLYFFSYIFQKACFGWSCNSKSEYVCLSQPWPYIQLFSSFILSLPLYHFSCKTIFKEMQLEFHFFPLYILLIFYLLFCVLNSGFLQLFLIAYWLFLQ